MITSFHRLPNKIIYFTYTAIWSQARQSLYYGNLTADKHVYNNSLSLSQKYPTYFNISALDLFFVCRGSILKSNPHLIEQDAHSDVSTYRSTLESYTSESPLVLSTSHSFLVSLLSNRCPLSGIFNRVDSRRELHRDCMETGRAVQHCISINTAAEGLMYALEHCCDEETGHWFPWLVTFVPSRDRLSLSAER